MTTAIRSADTPLRAAPLSRRPVGFKDARAVDPDATCDEPLV
jgi:hypothetical protein